MFIFITSLHTYIVYLCTYFFLIYRTNATKEENRDALIKDSEAFVIASAVLFVIQFILVQIGIDLINKQSLAQISRIRVLFLQALLRQDMSWYDTVIANNFASKMTE